MKFVAKIASDLAKPNGQREVPAEETVAFLAKLPVSRLWGVGPKTEEELTRAGLKTIGDVAARDVTWLEQRLGSQGRHLWELSQGIDAREVVPDRAAKSVGAEDTFEEDLRGVDLLRPHVHSQALRVGRRLRKAGVRGRVVQLKVKFADFTIITRRTTLSSPTDDGQALYRAALELLERAHEGRPVRLTGVSVQSLGEQEPPRQLGLFSAPAPPRRAARSSTPRWIASPSASAPRPSPPRISRRAAVKKTTKIHGDDTDMPRLIQMASTARNHRLRLIVILSACYCPDRHSTARREQYRRRNANAILLDRSARTEWPMGMLNPKPMGQGGPLGRWSPPS